MNTTDNNNNTPLKKTIAISFGLALGALLILAASIVFPENTSR